MRHTLGNRLDFSGAAQRWNPRFYGYYARQWEQQNGAWGATEEVPGVTETVKAFQVGGARAGLRTARRLRVVSGAELYLAVRAETEEQLAARLAGLRANLVKKPNPIDAQRAAFLEARLEEVRHAIKQGATPPQAVVDKPELPRREVPRWIPFLAIGLSVTAFLRSLR